MRVVWNFLSLGIIPVIMVKTCLSFSPPTLLWRHHTSLSWTPQASVSQKASAWSSCLALQVYLLTVTPLSP